MSDTSTINNQMEGHALAVVNLAQTSAQQKLDFSENSIKIVEDILGRLHSEKQNLKANPSRDIIERVCEVYGAYIGEVMRRKIGGEWVLDDKISPGRKIISLQVGHLQTFPPGKVFKRIMDGPGDDVWFYYRVFVEQCLENDRTIP